MNKYNVTLATDFDISAESFNEATMEARKLLVDELEARGVSMTTMERVFTVIIEERK